MNRNEHSYLLRLKDLTAASLTYLSQEKYVEADWCRREQLRVQELLRHARRQTK